MLSDASGRPGATVSAYPVRDPERYSLAEFDENGGASFLGSWPA